MATVNNRKGSPQAVVINGVDAGGVMTAVIRAGYDNIMKSSPDGLQVAVKDKEIQFVRGTIVSQDWVHALELLTGTVGTLVFYERESGTDTYTKHTINKPVIHKIAISLNQGGYGSVSFDFECKPDDETKGIADMWVPLAAQVAPAYVSAARGGYRIVSAVHGAVSINHVTGFNFSISMPLSKACNDSDVGYTCVDALLENMACEGSIDYQSGVIAAAKVLGVTLLTAAKADLVLTLTQSQGATAKTLTIANVDFSDLGSSSSSGPGFTGYTNSFDVANDAGTPLTLAGANPIITIA